jgi:dihydropteroate synthase
MTFIQAQLGNLIIDDNPSSVIMGVINRDPQSFFRGSFYKTQKQALRTIEQMIKDGAKIIDVGGYSTAPGTIPVSSDIEEERVCSLIKKIASNWDIPISIDTQRSMIARKALSLGASIVNDVSGLKSDPAMAKEIRDAGAGCILMACIQKPGDCKTMKQIISALHKSIQLASNAGISLNHIVVDPGIGFGKPTECDLVILRELQTLRKLSQPILVGVSRKSFIGKILGYSSPFDRLPGTLAAVTIATLNGAHIIRAHDVRETNDCIKLVNAIQSSKGCES